MHWSGPLDLLGWTAGYMTESDSDTERVGRIGAAVVGRLEGAADGAVQRAYGRWMLICRVFMMPTLPKVDRSASTDFFYTVFPLSLGAGIFLWGLARRGGAVRWFAYLSAGALAWTALAFWVQRLMQASF